MQTAPRPATPLDWHMRARWLAAFTVVWNVVEGLVSLRFGWVEEAVALFGFGLDSWVEVGSAAVVAWKLTRVPGCATTLRARERAATRWISGLFVLFAAVIGVSALVQLVLGGHPSSTIPSVIVSLASLGVMGFLWRAKLAAARALDSRTLEMDAACSLACIQLSGVLLAGSILFLWLPALWWADSVAALVLAAFIAREGVEGLRAAARPDFAGGCGCSG